MCVGALLEADVDGLVYALTDPERRRWSAVQLRTATPCRAACGSSPGIMQARGDRAARTVRALGATRA